MTMVSHREKTVARSLSTLIPLMKQDLEAAKEAADAAAKPYFESFALKLIEADENFVGRPRAEFYSWVWRHFKIKDRQTQIYLSLGNTLTNPRTPAHKKEFTSLDDFRRRELGETRIPGSQRDKAILEPVKEVLEKVDIDLLNIRKRDAEIAEERSMRQDLAIQLIDIGYKVLAQKLHPDKDGSTQAMARLNQVRKRLNDLVKKGDLWAT